MKFRTTWIWTFALAAILAGWVGVTAVAAKPPSGADAAKAEAGATVTLAGIKISRVALDDDPGLADVKDALGGIYDRQESAVKDGLTKLRDAAGDSAKTTAAIAAIQAANSESTQYFTAHADIKAKVTKRVAIINNEVKQITDKPDTYIANLGKAGLAGASLAQAKSIVKDAAPKGDADSAGAALAAHAQVRKLLSTKQSQALDALMGGK